METHMPAAERVFRLAVAPIRQVTVRDATGTGDGSWTIEGYAAVYEQETVLYDGRWFRVKEVIARGAFQSVLQRVGDGGELVHLNFGHDMNTSIAASNVRGIGGLELSDDDHGLRFFARVDPDDPDAQRLAAKLRRGVVGQASFAFTVASEECITRDLDDGREEDLYRVIEIGHLYDVCACPQGAYPQTESHLRSYAQASLSRTGLDAAGIDRQGAAVAAMSVLGRVNATRALAGAEALVARRADAQGLCPLVAMYEQGQTFIAHEGADSGDVQAMQQILGQLDTLIQAEAAESGDVGMNADASPGYMSADNGRSLEGAGANTNVASAAPTGVQPSREAGGDDQATELMRLKARASVARFTHTKE